MPFYKIGTIGDKADAYISKKLFEEYKQRYNYPKCGEVMITCAGTVGKTILYNGQDAYYQDSNIVWISNPRKIYSNEFLNYLLNRVDWSKLNSTTITRIYNDNLRELHITFPSREEQDKIVSLLTRIDDRIDTQSKIIEEQETLLRSLRHKIYSRVQAESQCTIADVLCYEQPTKYLVTDTDYTDDDSQVPVLTANKAFILGYTTENFGIYDKGPCIILDDFTLDCKYVDFKFKVKSSAIKILRAKAKTNLRFIFEYFRFLELNTTEHRRHYIAEIEPMSILLPSNEEIDRIARLFTALDERLEAARKELKILESQKMYMLQKMFI